MTSWDFGTSFTHTSVTINILGSDDAAVLSADVRSLTETNSAADISSSGTLTITDPDSPDSPGNFVAQAGTVGTYGTFAINAAGAWTYTASSAHNEFRAGTTYTDTFSVASADGTLTSVTINIAGSNDAADLSADVRNLTETNSAAAISSSGTLTVSDIDSAATFVAQAGTVGFYGTFAINSGGVWTYTAGSAHNEFQAGTTDTFSVASADGTLTSVTINIAGSNDAADLSADVRNLTETNSAAAISSSGTLTISDPDSATTFVAQGATVGLYGTFAITPPAPGPTPPAPPTTSSRPEAPTPIPSRSPAPTARSPLSPSTSPAATTRRWRTRRASAPTRTPPCR